MPLISISIPAREPAGDSPWLVLLHGLASDENDAGLASELDPRLNILSIRAPYETGYGGYSWFGIEFLTDGSRNIDGDQAVESRELLIEELRALGTPSKLIVGGFSQGAMMAAGVVFADPNLVDAAWLMSGRYLPSLDNGAQPLRAIPILQQHGLYDEVLEVAEGRELAQVLAARGHQIRYVEYPMAHQISYESLQEANSWFKQILG